MIPSCLLTSCFSVCAVVLLASSHPVAFVQSKLSQDSKDSAASAEPHNPQPATPNPKGADASADAATSDATTTSDTSASAAIEDFKVEPAHISINPSEQVTFEADQEQTINSDTLHALVEQLRPSPSPAAGLEQIVIIRTVDSGEHNPSEQ